MYIKHTFWTLCQYYSKIEIPIIQRDYAQGRNTSDVIRVRDKFINQFLISSLLDGKKIELDFVYGSVLTEKKHDGEENIFIPLDGQQRLTTLFLLHFFVALKEKRLDEVRPILSKFTYETRPSAHDFCNKLINEFTTDSLTSIRQDIKDTQWYSENWDNDPTISGMLNMLNTFSENEKLVNANANLLDRLLSGDSELISFYFIALEKFGLTENLYIRMNARGKMLTNFENFKSEFYKIINYNHELLDQVKEKIEYDWVDNLWDYREKDSYVVDAPFMQYLSFITEMLYFKQAEFRAAKYETDFSDFRIFKTIYCNEDNLKFLIFSLDFIKQIKEYEEINILWKEQTSLHKILQQILAGRHETTELYILFASLSYFYNDKNVDNYYDFIRVVRNLIHNTRDNSRREWPKLIASFENLISDENVYELLIQEKFYDKLDGFYVPQRKEEIFKAKLIKKNPTTKQNLFEAEDVENFSGEVTNLILCNYADTIETLNIISIDTTFTEDFNTENFSSLLSAYNVISKNYFNEIWGDLIISDLYTQTNDSRLTYSYNYRKNKAVLFFAKKYSWEAKSMILSQYIIKIRKEYIRSISNIYQSLDTVRDVKIQLYLYFLIHMHVNQRGFGSFFKNGYNFGWLAKERGYKSIFSKGIENCRWFPLSNPIFQSYKEQFRYNLGINQKNTIDEEIVGSGNKRDPFTLLKNWSQN